MSQTQYTFHFTKIYIKFITTAAPVLEPSSHTHTHKHQLLYTLNFQNVVHCTMTTYVLAGTVLLSNGLLQKYESNSKELNNKNYI